MRGWLSRASSVDGACPKDVFFEHGGGLRTSSVDGACPKEVFFAHGGGGLRTSSVDGACPKGVFLAYGGEGLGQARSTELVLLRKSFSHMGET